MGSDLDVGRSIAHYEIEAVLGRGGMGTVYRARDTRLGRSVAVKVLAREQVADETFRDRFLRESRLLASLDHPNIIPVFEAGEADGLLYLAMRLVPDPDLARVIRLEGALGAARSVAIVSQIADALDAAHAAGLIHRDVKPANVLLARGRSATGGGSTSGGHVYLSDFGLTRSTSSQTELTQTGHLVGTPGFVAPEQIEGSEGVDHRVDVYALGCVLFDCLTGDVPFPRDSTMAALIAHLKDRPPRPSDRLASLGTAFDEVIERALAKSPADRYESCGALAEAARQALAASTTDEPGRTTRESAALPAATGDQAATLPSRRRPAAATRLRPRRHGLIALTVAAAALILAAGTLTSRVRPDASPSPSLGSDPVLSPSAGGSGLSNDRSATPDVSISPDPTGPTGGGIALVGRFNGDENRSVTSDSALTVLVTGIPSDESGVTGIAVAESAVRPATVLPYATSTTVTLRPGASGPRVVYAWFVDARGNWSEPVTGTIDFVNPPVAGTDVRFGGVCLDEPQKYVLLPYVASDRDGQKTLRIVTLWSTNADGGARVDRTSLITPDGAAAVLRFEVVGTGDSTHRFEFVVRDDTGAESRGVFVFDFTGC